MTTRSEIDRIKTAAGQRRKAAARAIQWAREQMPKCTTDAMKARLLEALMERAEGAGK